VKFGGVGKVGISNWSLRNRLILATISLSAIAIITSDFAAGTLLRSFLIKEVDSQLTTITGNSLMRLDRAGIDPNANGGGDDGQGFRPVRPLGAVPTQVRVTLLDLTGEVVGHLGGDISESASTNIFKALTPAEVVSHQGKPFTLDGENGQSPIRVVAKLLPSGVGTVAVSLSLSEVDKTLGQLTFFYILISLFALIFIAAFGWALIQLSLRPLHKIEDTAAAIAEGDLSARLPEVNPKTEVGRLTGSLNAMLSRIEESFAVRRESEERLRRFVADASHELRTPLTAIRGFAELHRQGAVAGEDKVKELVARIENESIRMSSLVEDLLLLARLDQTPTVAKDPVDINHLVAECVESAKAAGKDHEIKFDLPSEDVFVLGDSMRIHQAVANLLANARTHTPAGTKITVDISQNEKEITISVSDNGPGLSAADQTRIFERFFRADPARVRNSGEGSGLGLAIVDAVMKAHSGSVSVDSKLGSGASFTLHFPINN
jgi:two-component system, OmpR family, sensor kinase